jgi:hypothetical protein
VIQARFEMDDYTVRVLDVIKGKYGLKNRDEALKRLVLENGDKYVDPVPNEMVLRELDVIYEGHKKKYGNKTMDDVELKKLLRL